jgi:transmembrane sensor
MNIHDQIPEELLARYLARTASEAEIQQVEDWLAISETHVQEFEGYKIIWQQTEKMQQGKFPVNTDLAWKKVKSKMDAIPSGSDASIKIRNLNNASPVITNKRKPVMFWAAAVIAALMMSYGWYMMQPAANKSLQVATTENTREEILPDGSKVFLNYNSSLTYPEHFEGTERKVVLKGEAFFDVRPDAAHPFVIDANGTEVKVLGTSFNVKAYAKEPVRVDVETGKVSVTKGETNIKLSKGESAIVAKDTVRSILPDLNKMGYRTQVYDFVATDLEDVVSSIRNGYHIDLRLSDEKTAQCRLTIRFEKEPVDATLGVIAETMNLKIRKEGNIYWLDGNSCQ